MAVDLRLSALDVEVLGFVGTPTDLRLSAIDVEVLGSVEAPVVTEVVVPVTWSIIIT